MPTAYEVPQSATSTPLAPGSAFYAPPGSAYPPTTGPTGYYTPSTRSRRRRRLAIRTRFVPGSTQTYTTPGSTVSRRMMVACRQCRSLAPNVSGPLWRIPGAEVSRGGSTEALGAIQSIEGDLAVVVVAETGETMAVPLGELGPVAPRKRDRVRIVDGEHAGQTGTLIGIDGTDGIVKLDVDLDIKILSLQQIVRWKGVE
jgi:transcription elongation factor SPT5